MGGIVGKEKWKGKAFLGIFTNTINLHRIREGLVQHPTQTLKAFGGFLSSTMDDH